MVNCRVKDTMSGLPRCGKSSAPESITYAIMKLTLKVKMRDGKTVKLLKIYGEHLSSVGGEMGAVNVYTQFEQ